MKSYSELIRIKNFGDRLEYLKCKDIVVDSPRLTNIYKTRKWKDIRKKVIERDLGCNLGVLGEYIDDYFLVHHINQLSIFDIENDDFKIYDLDNLITTDLNTHNIIHYKNDNNIAERKIGDTLLWK